MSALTNIRIGLAAGITLCLGSAVNAQQSTEANLDGRWDARLTVNNAVVPFRLDISGEGPTLKGTLYNGDDRETTTSASFKDGTVILNLEHYLTKITATEKDGQLDGKIQMRNGEGGGYEFHAKRYAPSVAAVPKDVPQIDGVWEVPLNKPTPKGEKAWRFIVKQNGAEASATFLRVDGDTGALTGSYHDGKFVLSHFDGSRPGLMDVSLTKDGTLDILEKASNRPGTYIAYRPEVARAKG
jgi:hypothetical protein